jgi:hypothetical protein
LPGGRLPIAHLHAAFTSVAPAKVCLLLDCVLENSATPVAVLLQGLGAHARLVCGKLSENKFEFAQLLLVI